MRFDGHGHQQVLACHHCFAVSKQFARRAGTTLEVGLCSWALGRLGGAMRGASLHSPPNPSCKRLLGLASHPQALQAVPLAVCSTGRRQVARRGADRCCTSLRVLSKVLPPLWDGQIHEGPPGHNHSRTPRPGVEKGAAMAMVLIYNDNSPPSPRLPSPPRLRLDRWA